MWLFQLQLPQVRLWFWQGLLVACLVLPFVQPRHESQVNFTVEEGVLKAGTPVKITGMQRLPAAEAVFAVYLAGVGLRAVWLLLGCWRLRRYRRDSVSLDAGSAVFPNVQQRLQTFPEVCISQEITSPVTFASTILLPPGFLHLDERTQQAIAVHEVMHVKRGDWFFSLGEELVRSIFWFHPAIWWLLAQIQLTREQVVDRATIEFTLSREQYLEALLAVAKTKVRQDLMLVPLFLKKRYLARRVAAVMKEVKMSKRQIISSLSTVSTLAALTAAVAIWIFPLESSAQDADSGQNLGVSIETQGHKLLHGSRVEYPQAAREARVEGTVVLQLSLDAKGEVADARVQSGPDELRRSALSSALQWHFANETGQDSVIQSAVTFKLAAGSANSLSRPRIPELSGPSIFKSIGWGPMASKEMFEKVRDALPRLGEPMTSESLQRIAETVHQIDEHLTVGFIVDPKDNSGSVIIDMAGGKSSAPLSSSNFSPPATEGVKRVRVGGNVQAAKITNKVTPKYPPLAKQSRIQGTVRYNVLISKDGAIKVMELVSGHPLLVEAATPAVQQWQYEPTFLNGEPVEVVTVIDMNFTLAP